MEYFNERQFLNKLKKFSYQYEIEHDETYKILYVYIYPICESDNNYCKINSDVIDFMISEGFKIDQIVFSDPMVGMLMLFYREVE